MQTEMTVMSTSTTHQATDGMEQCAGQAADRWWRWAACASELMVWVSSSKIVVANMASGSLTSTQ